MTSTALTSSEPFHCAPADSVFRINYGHKGNSHCLLIRSEKRCSRDPQLDAAYFDYVEGSKKIGHLRLSTLLEIKLIRYSMPHHGVFKIGNRKLRVVYNASQKGSNGISLNDLMFIGLKLQQDITAVLTRWKFFKIVFTADIIKMYRQILVYPDGLCWQHLLCRLRSTNPIQDCVMCTVTDGTGGAAFIAISTFLTLAAEVQFDFPVACTILKEQIHMDDSYAEPIQSAKHSQPKVNS